MTKMPYANAIKISLFCVLASLNRSSCTYRFTNVAMSPPVGINTIAIESIYNTSRDVIPHEILWQSLSEQFAKNGRLLIASKDNADAILIIQLSDARVFPSGSPSSEAIYKDPVVTATDKRTPFEFKNLRRAGNWTTEETLSFSIQAKVHNLRNKKVLFNRNYSTSGRFRSIRASSVTTANAGYLMYEEALAARMKPSPIALLENRYGLPL